MSDRLISADKFKAYMQDKYLLFDQTLEDIDAQPTVDAVEVVRCEDCQWFIPFRDRHDGVCAVEHPYSTTYIFDEDYCSRGERKERR